MRWRPKTSLEDTEVFYTAGNEYMTVKTLKPYTGLYYKKEDILSTYKESQQSLEERLTKINNNSDFRIYYKNKKKRYLIEQLPQDTAIIPTEKDYDNGYIDRYFTKKSNDINKPIKEVSSDYFSFMKGNKHLKVLYKAITLRWKLTGPLHDVNINKVYNPYSTTPANPFCENNSDIVYGVEDTNKRTLRLKDKEMKGISTKLINLIQFARISNYP